MRRYKQTPWLCVPDVAYDTDPIRDSSGPTRLILRWFARRRESMESRAQERAA